MQDLKVCHCGKCDIKCNKHGKKAKCSDCGKRRILGTAIEKGVMRHICNECCDKENKRVQIEQDEKIMKSLRLPDPSNQEENEDELSS